MAKAKPKLIAALTCEQVITDKTKDMHTLVGLFSDIHAENFPAKHPHMVLFCAWGKAGASRTYRLEIKVKDPDNGNLAKVDVELKFEKGKIRTYAIFNFQNLVFKKAGQYAFEIYLDGEMIAAVPVNVGKPPN